ncbi:MAG: T9SS type A sorting domain-containing protein [Saprospiraceae bacterium]
MCILFACTSYSQKAFDPFLSNLGFNIKPYKTVGQHDVYSFVFGNLGVCSMPVSRGPLTITIKMSQDTVVPNSGNPLTDLSGGHVPYFSWVYNSGSNSFVGTQIADIPGAGFSGGGISSGASVITVAIIYGIGTSSSQNFGQGGNGVLVSLSVPSYATGPTSPAIPDCSITQTGGNTNNDNQKAYNYLPINLIDFNVKKIKNQTSRVYWSTASEFSILNFQIKRSIETPENWQIINIQAGAGNTEKSKSYSFDDILPSGTRKVFYKMETIDVDGSIKYTAIRSIRFDQSTNNFSLDGFPNPTKSKYTINLETLKDESLAIEIIDLLGKRISMEIMKAKSGFNTHDLNLSALSSGTYIVKVSGGGVMDTSKVMKVD